jgi:hypothetical protein
MISLRQRMAKAKSLYDLLTWGLVIVPAIRRSKSGRLTSVEVNPPAVASAAIRAAAIRTVMGAQRRVAFGLFAAAFLWAAPMQAQQLATNIVSVRSPSAEGSRQICSSQCQVFSPYVTTGAAAGFLLIFDQASSTPPADGAVTPADCIQVAATTSAGPPTPTFGKTYNLGALAVFSTTGCFTKTISNTAFFNAQRQQP